MRYEHYIDDVRVYPSGEWSISHTREGGQIFLRPYFSGSVKFGNEMFNHHSDDYDYIMGLASTCDKIDYEIRCTDGTVLWTGYINVPLDLEIDEDACTVNFTPNVEDKYTCIVNLSDVEYSAKTTGTHTVYLYECEPEDGVCGYVELGNCGQLPTLKNYINYIINTKMGCFANVDDIVSTFFWNDDFPDGTAYPDDNYVTGATNMLSPDNDYNIYFQLLDRIIWQLGGDYHVENPTITFNKLMGYLRDKFQVYWYIDENNKFRLEHIYYFDPDFPESDHTDVTNRLTDLTILENRSGHVWARGINKISYNKELFYQSEIFEENNTEYINSNEDFVGMPIVYDVAPYANCHYDFPRLNIKEYNLPDITTDIDYVYNHAQGTVGYDDIYDSGFMFIHAINERVFKIDTTRLTGWDEGGDTYDTFTTNNHVIQVCNYIAPGLKFGHTDHTIGVGNGDVWQICVPDYVTNNVPPANNHPTMGFWDTVGGAWASTQAVLNAPGQYEVTITAPNGNYVFRVQNDHAPGVDVTWSGTFYLHRRTTAIRRVACETGVLSGNEMPNVHLSWANLHDNYWRHNRAQIEGTMNGAADVFETTTYKKVQQNVIYEKGSNCCELLGHFGMVRTDQGWGIIQEAEETETIIKLTLYHE